MPFNTVNAALLLNPRYARGDLVGPGVYDDDRPKSPIAWYLYYQQQVLNSEPGPDLQPIADLLEAHATPIAAWNTVDRDDGTQRLENVQAARLRYGAGAAAPFPWTGAAANYIRNGGRQPAPDGFEAGMRQALLAVMRRGTVPVALCDINGRIVGNAGTRLANIERAPPSTLVNWGAEQEKYGRILACVKRAARDIVGFRGIGANVTVQMVLRDWRGLACWADTLQGRTRHNMDDACYWNPLSDAEHRRYMYFRPQANDNCLLTCSSFCPSTLQADAFKITTCFPKISGYSEQKKQELTQEVRFTDTPLNGGDARQGRRNCIVDVSRSFLVCIRRNEMYFDTNAAQEIIARGSGYPEMALRKIPADHILGCVTYVRVFHGEVEEDGYTAFPVTSASGLFEGPGAAEGASALLQRALTSFSASWAAAGFDASSPRAKPGWGNGRIAITHVGGTEVANGRLAEFDGASLGHGVVRTADDKLRIPGG